jgi:very-short-patch-repair endonuclease
MERLERGVKVIFMKISSRTILARTLRQKQSNAEKKMWSILRSRQFENNKFRRQDPIGRYIVDFVSYEKKLIIEIDGGQHNNILK